MRVVEATDSREKLMGKAAPRNVLNVLRVGEHITVQAGTPTMKDGEPLTITVQLEIPFESVESLEQLEAFIRPWMDEVFKSVDKAWDSVGVGDQPKASALTRDRLCLTPTEPTAADVAYLKSRGGVVGARAEEL